MHYTKATAFVALGAAAVGAALGAPASAADHDLTSTPATVLENLTGPSLLGSGSLSTGPLASILDGSSVLALPWQFCGSQVNAGAVLDNRSYSPNMVQGGCDNASVAVGHRHPCDDVCTLVYPPDCPVCQQLERTGAPATATATATEAAPAAFAATVHHGYGYGHGYGHGGPGSLISVGSGSAIDALPWQFCGSQVNAGAVLDNRSYSPNMVQGGCDNASTYIGKHSGDHGGRAPLISILDGTSLSVAPWQFCGSGALLGLGLLQQHASGNVVDGGCYNAATAIG